MVFFGTLALVVLISSVILVGQYLRGDLAEPRREDTLPRQIRLSEEKDGRRRRAA